MIKSISPSQLMVGCINSPLTVLPESDCINSCVSLLCSYPEKTISVRKRGVILSKAVLKNNRQRLFNIIGMAGHSTMRMNHVMPNKPSSPSHWKQDAMIERPKTNSNRFPIRRGVTLPTSSHTTNGKKRVSLFASLIVTANLLFRFSQVSPKCSSC